MTRFLRRLSVRQRIFGGFIILIVVMAASLPLIIFDHISLTAQLQQIVDVDVQANRLLLSAAVRVAASRANLLRYLRDTVPGPYEALDDVVRALEALEEAQALLDDPRQQQRVQQLREGLRTYEALILEIRQARVAGDATQVVTLEFQAQRLSNDISVQIERVVTQSQRRLEVANAAVRAESQRRLNVIIGSMLGVILASLLLAAVVERSISRPVAELRAGAEAFALGDFQVSIPAIGEDELSLLARTFNRMAVEISHSYSEMEAQVNARTRDLERRTAYLQAGAEVSRATAAILDINMLTAESVEIIRERFGLYYVGLFLVDEAGEWAELRAGTGPAGRAMLAAHHRMRVGEGMIGWSIANVNARVASQAEADAVRLSNPYLPETRSEAALPLRSRGKVLGALSVQDVLPNAFDAARLLALQTMADQIAVALDNAHLFAEAQASLEAERRAYGALSQQAWRQLLRERRMLHYGADVKGNLREATAPENQDGALMLREVGRLGRVVQVDAATVALPVKVRDAVVGVMRVHKSDANAIWTPEELALLETLMDQLGVALEGARLYHDTQLRAVRERLIGEVTARMRESLLLETVLKTSAHEIRQALNLEDVVVRLMPPQQGETLEDEMVGGAQ